MKEKSRSEKKRIKEDFFPLSDQLKLTVKAVMGRQLTSLAAHKEHPRGTSCHSSPVTPFMLLGDWFSVSGSPQQAQGALKLLHRLFLCT